MNKKIVLILIVAVICLGLIQIKSFASTANIIQLEGNSDVKEGTEQTLELKANLNNNKLEVIKGKIIYDSTYIEKISIVKAKGWTITFNENNNMFLGYNLNGTTQGDILIIKYKLKENVNGNMTIKISNIETTTESGTNNVAEVKKEIKINKEIINNSTNQTTPTSNISNGSQNNQTTNNIETQKPDSNTNENVNTGNANTSNINTTTNSNQSNIIVPETTDNFNSLGEDVLTEYFDNSKGSDYTLYNNNLSSQKDAEDSAAYVNSRKFSRTIIIALLLVIVFLIFVYILFKKQEKK